MLKFSASKRKKASVFWPGSFPKSGLYVLKSVKCKAVFQTSSASRASRTGATDALDATTGSEAKRENGNAAIKTKTSAEILLTGIVISLLITEERLKKFSQRLYCRGQHKFPEIEGPLSCAEGDQESSSADLNLLFGDSPAGGENGHLRLDPRLGRP